MRSEQALCSVLLLSGGAGISLHVQLRQMEIPPDFPRIGNTGLMEFLTLLQIINTLKATTHSTSVQESKLPKPKLLILVSNLAPIPGKGEKTKNALMGAGLYSQLLSRLFSPLVMHHLLGALSLCQAQQELTSKLIPSLKQNILALSKSERDPLILQKNHSSELYRNCDFKTQGEGLEKASV